MTVVSLVAEDDTTLGVGSREGRDPRAGRASTVRAAERITVSTLVLAGAQDDRIPVDVRDKDVGPFIDEVLRGGPDPETARAPAGR